MAQWPARAGNLAVRQARRRMGMMMRHVRSGVLNGMSLGLPIAIMADVHYMREAVMRLVARLSICFMPILANAAQTDAQSDPQAYCVPERLTGLTRKPLQRRCPRIRGY